MNRLTRILFTGLLVALKGVALLAGVWWGWKAVALGLMRDDPGAYCAYGTAMVLCLIVILVRIDIRWRE